MRGRRIENGRWARYGVRRVGWVRFSINSRRVATTWTPPEGSETGKGLKMTKNSQKPPGKALVPRGKALGPPGKGAVPRGKAPVPRGKAPVPRGKAAVPGGKALVPDGKAPVPGGKTLVPGGRGAVPGGKAGVPPGKGGKPNGLTTVGALRVLETRANRFGRRRGPRALR